MEDQGNDHPPATQHEFVAGFSEQDDDDDEENNKWISCNSIWCQHQVDGDDDEYKNDD